MSLGFGDEELTVPATLFRAGGANSAFRKKCIVITVVEGKARAGRN